MLSLFKLENNDINYHYRHDYQNDYHHKHHNHHNHRMMDN